MRDSFDREIRYLRISVTDRCNLRCVYCMPEEGVPWMDHARVISFEDIRDTVAAAVSLGFDKFRLTGGEPLVRKGILDLVSMLRAVPGVGTLAMTTNGTRLAPLAAALKASGLDSVNVSLDTLDPARYAAVTRRGDLADAVAGIEAAAAAGLKVKLNVVVMEAYGERDLAEIRAWAAARGLAVQSIARYDLASDKLDEHAYDRPPPCATCDRIRLLADGTLRPCLRSSLGVSLDRKDPAASIRQCIHIKPAAGATCDDLSIAQIGG
ncbi:MAG: radical SAM protein [Spirochaetales bacterium]|nr:radical SAM protein [Spirochaetales bacterium]